MPFRNFGVTLDGCERTCELMMMFDSNCFIAGAPAKKKTSMTAFIKADEYYFRLKSSVISHAQKNRSRSTYFKHK